MRHETQGYPPLSCPNPAIDALRRHGRIRCAGRTAPIREALGANPANPAALRVLLSHPMADRIKEAFELSEPVWEPVGEEDPVPVVDAWPGLARFLSADDRRCAVVRCQRIAAPDGGNAEAECARIDSTVYLAGAGDEIRDLRLVSRELGVPLDPHQVDAVLRYAPPHEIKARRDAIRELASDAERLASAVGDDKLRSGLPRPSLLAVLETGRPPLTGVDLAEAAIATYHTGALRNTAGLWITWLRQRVGRGRTRCQLRAVVGILRRMGRTAQFTPPAVCGSGRAVSASATARLPKDHRRQGTGHAPRQARRQRSPARNDQPAHRFGQDSGRRPSRCRGYEGWLRRRRPLGGGPRRIVRAGRGSMAAGLVRYWHWREAPAHFQDVGRAA